MDTTEPRSAKRPRIDAEAAGAAATPSSAAAVLSSLAPLHDDEGIQEESNVVDLLSVPLSVIFMEVPHHRRQKPLLSRAEAQAFLNIILLAQEMDSLVAASATALQQKLRYSSFSRRIQIVDHPFLRSLLPLLSVFSDQSPDECLVRIQNELHRIVAELRAAALSLQQFSEQNWTLSESLMDAAGATGLVFAKLKKQLSDVQEESANRIDSLLLLTTTTTTTGMPQDSTSTCTMQEYCARVFTPNAKTASPPADLEPPSLPFQQSLPSASAAETPEATTTWQNKKKEEESPSSHHQNNVLLREKENLSSQPSSSSQGNNSNPSPAAAGGLALVYGSSSQEEEACLGESQTSSCRQAMNAAEMLSVLANSAATTTIMSPK